MIPIRYLFRSRWAALAWSVGICASALHIAGHHDAGPVDARTAATNESAQSAALAAEDRD